MMEQYWKTKLNPFDTELAIMVESLTGKPCELKNGGNHYFFEADYEKHNDPQYILAIWDAIEGRTGKRLISIKDDADRHALLVRVKFSKTEYPGLVYLDRDDRPKPAAADVFRLRNDAGPCVWALQVTRENVGRLLAFVGNGEMEIERRPDGKATFHFRNAVGSVYAHAPEFSYIVHVKDGLFNVVDKTTFEAKYEPK